MKSSIWADFFKLVAAFVIAWAVFIFASEYIPDYFNVDFKKSAESLRISIEDEERLGDLISEMYLDDKTIVTNAVLDSGLSVIYDRLLEGLEESKYEIRFYVVESDMVNAMTFPGGNVVINTSLIEFSNSPEEFAAVVAHEIGHAELRHVVDRMVAEIGMTVLVSFITGGDATVIHEAIGALLSNAYSRSQESEADLFGMKLLERSRIDPKSIGQFFERLNESDLGFDERLELLMSHPHNNSRAESSMQYQVEEGFSSRPLPLDWNRIKASL